MKRIVFLSVFCLLAGAAFGQTIRNGAILEFHHFSLHLDPDVSRNQWTDFALNTYLPLWETTFEGIESQVLVGERGEEIYKYLKGELAVVLSKNFENYMVNLH